MTIFLIGVAIFVVGSIVSVACGFSIWRRLGGPTSGKRLADMDRTSAPASIRAIGRVGALTAICGAVTALAGLLGLIG